MYVDIKTIDLIKFNNCKNCDRCCREKLFAPLILEDFKKVYKYFPIVVANINFLRPIMLLSNGVSCPYLKESKCSIYENRPPACKIYPFSPYYEKILLDISCDGIGIDGEVLPFDNFKHSKFYDERFENITQKIDNTLKWLRNKKFKILTKIENIEIYEIIGDDYYSILAKESLSNLVYFKNLIKTNS